jgi:hypothetical protein
MNLIRKILSEFLWKSHFKKSTAGNLTDIQHNDTGAFKYHEKGFTIHFQDFFKELDWDDITQLNVYKVDLFTLDRIDMEIVYSDKAFTINEELPGWHQFVLKTKEVFPSIPKDWEIKIVQPPFVKNFMTIYLKEV